MKEYTKRDSCMTMEEVIERNTGMSLKAFLALMDLVLFSFAATQKKKPQICLNRGRQKTDTIFLNIPYRPCITGLMRKNMGRNTS